MIKKMYMSSIALAVSSTFTCASAYADACVSGKGGNTFMSTSAETRFNTDAETRQLAKDYGHAFVRLGLTPTQAAGVIGNLMLESAGLNSGILQQTGTIGEPSMKGDVVNQTGYGLAQWGEERKAGLIKMAAGRGVPASSQCANMLYLTYELAGAYAEAITAVKASTNLKGAVDAFEQKFEQASEPNMDARYKNAQDVLTWMGGSNAVPPPPDTVPSGPDTGHFCSNTGVKVEGNRTLSAADITSLDGFNKGNHEYEALHLKVGDTMALQDFYNWMDETNDGSKISGPPDCSNPVTVPGNGPATPPGTPPVLIGKTPPDGTGGWGELDLKIGKDKIVEFLPLIKDAAAKNGIDWKELAAIILQEGRGLTADQLLHSAGLAQMGAPEINSLRIGTDPLDGDKHIPPHPELTDGDPFSPNNQIYGAAAYLALLKEKAGSMDGAIHMYNGGGNSTTLNDPEYMTKHAAALVILESFGL